MINRVLVGVSLILASAFAGYIYPDAIALAFTTESSSVQSSSAVSLGRVIGTSLGG
jgi:hypothetical protein